jgi:hypothetical protein
MLPPLEGVLVGSMEDNTEGLGSKSNVSSESGVVSGALQLPFRERVSTASRGVRGVQFVGVTGGADGRTRDADNNGERGLKNRLHAAAGAAAGASGAAGTERVRGEVFDDPASPSFLNGSVGSYPPPSMQMSTVGGGGGGGGGTRDERAAIVPPSSSNAPWDAEHDPDPDGIYE